MINLVTRGTIEEQILALANTKLALDHSVSGEDANDAVAGRGEELVAKMMLGRSAESAEATPKDMTPVPEVSTKVTTPVGEVEGEKTKKG